MFNGHTLYGNLIPITLYPGMVTTAVRPVLPVPKMMGEGEIVVLLLFNKYLVPVVETPVPMFESVIVTFRLEECGFVNSTASPVAV